MLKSGDCDWGLHKARFSGVGCVSIVGRFGSRFGELWSCGFRCMCCVLYSELRASSVFLKRPALVGG
jgi:hypothetical protein